MNCLINDSYVTDKFYFRNMSILPNKLTFKQLLPMYLFVVTIYRGIILGYTIYAGIFHVYRYTYWNYTLLWVFDLLYFFAVFIEGGFLKYMTLYAYPIIHGSNFLVFSLIIIIIQCDDAIFLEGTVYDGGDLRVGDLHTGDYIVHVFPIIETLITLLFGLLYYVRAVIDYHNRHTTNILSRDVYFVYWVLSPLIPISIYTVFFDPFTEYPTHLNKSFAISILLLLCILYMLFNYVYITTSTKFPITISTCKVSTNDVHSHFTVPDTTIISSTNEENLKQKFKLYYY